MSDKKQTNGTTDPTRPVAPLMGPGDVKVPNVGVLLPAFQAVEAPALREIKPPLTVPASFGPFADPMHNRAYAAGAAAYAMGLSLDRLAKDMGAEPRARHESDHDLSQRLRQQLIGPG